MLSLSSAVPQQVDTIIAASSEEDSPSIAHVGDEAPEAAPQETPRTEALIALDRALDVLIKAAGPLELQRQASVPAGLLAQMYLMLLDYRRTLESLGSHMMSLPTLQQRDCALAAYQEVCQRVMGALGMIDGALKGLQ